ncbi:hypothetical protein BTH42_11425 [Burkholderia sp. SRS-W-2-2016]|nr:hypothetical protein BTH42_11425 [Burkholderia sp. SRS-W-2-2016]
MSNIKNELKLYIYFLIFFLVIVGAGATFFEFIFWPALAWLQGDSYFPQIDRLYRWLKFAMLVVPVCSLITWIYQRSRR